MEAVVFEQFGEPADVLGVQDRPDPVAGPGEVRVRMITASVNPSDLMTVRGIYPRLPEPPATPGYEGMGVVESNGGGLLGRLFLGKRVAVAHRSGGTWAQYAVVPAKQAMPLPSGVSDEQGAMFFVNPVSAFAMTRRILAVPAGEWLLQTAAGSALGRMVIRLGQRFGFRTLNVVRRAEQIDELKAEGADAVVRFDEREHDPVQLREMIADIVGAGGVRYAIDPVGGATGSAAVNCLGKAGRMLTYGSLSAEPLTFDTRALITPGASVAGFWLTNYIDSLGLLAKIRLIKQVGRLVRNGILSADVGDGFLLADVCQAAEASEKPGRQGKVLLRIAE